MALSEENEVKICQILNVLPTVLTAQIDWLSTNLTSTIQTAIEDQITLWDAGAGTKTTKIHPRERNYGVETNPDIARSQIKQRIAVLLERPDWAASSSAYLPRG